MWGRILSGRRSTDSEPAMQSVRSHFRFQPFNDGEIRSLRIETHKTANRISVNCLHPIEDGPGSFRRLVPKVSWRGMSHAVPFFLSKCSLSYCLKSSGEQLLLQSNLGFKPLHQELKTKVWDGVLSILRLSVCVEIDLFQGHVQGRVAYEGGRSWNTIKQDEFTAASSRLHETLWWWSSSSLHISPDCPSTEDQRLSLGNH